MIRVHNLLFATLLAVSSSRCGGDMLRKRLYTWERNLGDRSLLEEAKYKYEVHVEEEVEVGGPYDNDKIADEDLICMETTLAKYLNKNALAYLAYLKGTPQPGDWGEAEQVSYKKKDVQVDLTVDQQKDPLTNMFHAVGKIFVWRKSEHVQYTKTVLLSSQSASGGGVRHLFSEEEGPQEEEEDSSLLNDHHEPVRRRLAKPEHAGPPPKKNKKKKNKKRRKWNATMKVNAKCHFCKPDNMDGSRRAMMSYRNMEGKMDFETFMNLRFQEQITSKCMGVAKTIIASRFWYAEKGAKGPPLVPADIPVAAAGVPAEAPAAIPAVPVPAPAAPAPTPVPPKPKKKRRGSRSQ